MGMKEIKLFAEKLNEVLDDMGKPNNTDHRINALSELLGVSKSVAASYIRGFSFPDKDTFEKLHISLDVNPKWLASGHRKVA